MKRGKSQEESFSLILEGNFAPIKKISDQRQGLAFNENDREEFLLSYLRQGSKKAASLLLSCHYTFSLKTLSDKDVSLLLSLLSPEAKAAQNYAKELLKSPRSECVKVSAASIFKTTPAQTAPKTAPGAISKAYSSQTLLKTAPETICKTITPQPRTEKPIAMKPGPRPAIGELRPLFRDQPQKAPPAFIHIVERGETLPQLARKYNLPVEYLMKVNNLRDQTIKPGKSIKILPLPR